MAKKLEDTILSFYDSIQFINTITFNSSRGESKKSISDWKETQIQLYLQEYNLPKNYEVVLDKRKGHYYMTLDGRKWKPENKKEEEKTKKFEYYWLISF